jgi:hypothetical protein
VCVCVCVCVYSLMILLRLNLINSEVQIVKYMENVKH